MNVARVSLLLLAWSLLFTGLASAEIKSVTKQYSYQATETDSKQSARWIALEQTRQLLLEELGSYLESLPDVQNFKLVKDDIISLVSGITTVEINKETWNREVYWIDAKISADVGSVIASIDKLRHNYVLRHELERENQLVIKALAEKVKLKEQVNAAYYDINKTAEYEKMAKQITGKQKNGEHFLALAKDAAKMTGQEQQARDYRQKAIDFLGEAVVQTELPEFRIYIPGKYSFSLREGEQTDHWLMFPDNETRFKIFQEKGSKFMRVYDDEFAATADKSFKKNKFKLRAVKNSYIVLEVMKDTTVSK